MSLEMPVKIPKYVHKEISRHGKVTFVFRRGKGKRRRLPDDPGSEEFAEAYAAAFADKNFSAERKIQTKSGTLKWLVDRYMESAKWADYSQATRKKNGLIFADAIKTAKNPPFADITTQTMQRSVNARKDTPAQANNFIKAMRGLFEWAITAEYVREDPTHGVKYMKDKTDGFPPWTTEDAAQFCAYWQLGTKPRLAFELFLASGLRRSDTHRIGPQHLKDGVLTIRALKPPHHVISVFVTDRLAEAIAATETGGMAYITKSNGMPYGSKESFGNWFGDRCREAGLPKGKSAHGIRKLAATLSADSGSTTHELMAQFGWSNTAQAETYTRGTDRKNLALRSSVRLSEQIEARIPRTPDTGAGKNSKASNKTTLKKRSGGR